MSLFGLFGPPNVEKLKAKGDVKGLIRASNYKKEAPVVEYLSSKVLMHEHEKVREAAIEALGKIGDMRAVDPLGKALKDKSIWVRQAAVKALGQIRTPQTVELLIVALKDNDHNYVRQAAAKVLGEVRDTQAVAPLIEMLKDRDSSVRDRAVEILGQIGDKRAVEPLIEMLKDKDDRVQIQAVRALGNIGDAQAVEPLIELLKDEKVRLSAVETLGQIGDKRAVEPLVTVLINADEWGLEKVAETLKQIDPEWMKSEVAKKAIPALVVALNNSNSNVQQRATKALKLLGWRPENDNERRLVDAIEAIKHRNWGEAVSLGAAAIGPLMAALKSESRISTSRVVISPSQAIINALQQILERVTSEIIADDLHALTRLEDVAEIRYTPVDCGADDTHEGIEKIDCSLVRQLARQELIRRGLEA